MDPLSRMGRNRKEAAKFSDLAKGAPQPSFETTIGASLGVPRVRMRMATSGGQGNPSKAGRFI
jgi:hypothetical protein